MAPRLGKGVIGGQKLRSFVAANQANQTRTVKEIEVGFFDTARYPPVHTGRGPRAGKPRQPHPVPLVALWMEFGNRGGASGGGWGGPIPERPFIRQAIAQAEDVLMPILKRNLDPELLGVDRRTAGLLGAAMQGLIQTSVTKGDFEDLSPVTVELKTSDKPLIDTGFLRKSVTYRIHMR